MVVNDLRGADAVVAEVQRLGGTATASAHDIADWNESAALVRDVLPEVDAIHGVVDNAGIVRDRLMVNMSPQEWEDVIRVHLRDTFCVSRHVAAHWSDRHKAGNPVDSPRLVNTSSPSGLFGNVGQSNYGAAKPGIASFTVITADELAKYGAMVNPVAPTALTAMTEGLASHKRARHTRIYGDRFRHWRSRECRTPCRLVVQSLLPNNWQGLCDQRRDPECRGNLGEGPKPVLGQTLTVEELAAVLPELVAAARTNSAMNGLPRESET